MSNLESVIERVRNIRSSLRESFGENLPTVQQKKDVQLCASIENYLENSDFNKIAFLSWENRTLPNVCQEDFENKLRSLSSRSSNLKQIFNDVHSYLDVAEIVLKSEVYNFFYLSDINKNFSKLGRMINAVRVNNSIFNYQSLSSLMVSIFNSGEEFGKEFVDKNLTILSGLNTETTSNFKFNVSFLMEFLNEEQKDFESLDFLHELIRSNDTNYKFNFGLYYKLSRSDKLDLEVYSKSYLKESLLNVINLNFNKKKILNYLEPEHFVKLNQLLNLGVGLGREENFSDNLYPETVRSSFKLILNYIVLDVCSGRNNDYGIVDRMDYIIGAKYLDDWVNYMKHVEKLFTEKDHDLEFDFFDYLSLSYLSAEMGLTMKESPEELKLLSSTFRLYFDHCDCDLYIGPIRSVFGSKNSIVLATKSFVKKLSHELEVNHLENNKWSNKDVLENFYKSCELYLFKDDNDLTYFFNSLFPNIWDLDFKYNLSEGDSRKINYTYHLAKNVIESMRLEVEEEYYEDEVLPLFNRHFFQALNEAISYGDNFSQKRGSFYQWARDVEKLIKQDPELLKSYFMQSYNGVGA